MTPTKGDGEVAGVSSSTPKALAATQWEVGQRVKVDERGVGTILYIGEIPQQRGLWYGVALDKVGNGKNNCTFESERLFYYLDTCGIFVRQKSLQGEKMEDEQDITLKTLLGGIAVSETKLNRLKVLKLRMFIKHADKDAAIDGIKPELIALASKLMGVVQPAAVLESAEANEVSLNSTAMRDDAVVACE